MNNENKVAKMEKQIFLSFSRQDKDLADELYKLLTEEFGFSVFYSPEDLPEMTKGVKGWNERIKMEISECKCFISLLTNKSIYRPWIVYESGIADAMNKTIIRVKTNNVSNEKIKKALPDQMENFNCELASKKSIRKIVESIHKVLEINVPNKEFIKSHLNSETTKPVVDEIIKLSRGKNIFIGGSYFSGKQNIDRVKYKGERIKGEKVMEKVIREITFDLLESGYTIWCYPFVSIVGKTIAKSVYEWCTQGDKNKNLFQYLKITGSEGRRSKAGKKSYQEFLQTGFSFEGLLDVIFKEERKKMISEMETVLIIGGNRKTRFEAELAIESKNVRFCPIPIFDGVGLEYWERLENKNKLPISKTDLIWSPEVRKKLFKYINR